MKNLDRATKSVTDAGTMSCPNCKEEVLATGAHCSQCGYKLPNQIPSSPECDPTLHYALKCVEVCGMPSEQKHCTQCGEKL